MKSILICYDQAHHEGVESVLNHHNCRGFSLFEQMQGRGSHTGQPHLGNHAWPGMCSALIAIVEDRQVASILEDLHQLDEASPQLGLRAFVWNIEETI